MTAYTYRAVTEQVEALFETVRTLACLMEQDARLSGHEGTARRIADLIAEELTWESDKEVVDAFGEPA